MKYIKLFEQYKLDENQTTQNTDVNKFRAIAQKVSDGKVKLKFQYNGITMKFASGKEETTTSYNTQNNEVVFKSTLLTEEVRLETGQLVIKLGKMGNETVDIPYGAFTPGMHSVNLKITPITELVKPVKLFDFAGGFDVDKWEILPEMQQLLDTKLKDLDINTKLHVDGYASSDGPTVEHDMKLSMNRADAIKKYLEEKGFKTVTAKGNGRTDKFGEKEQNRRIVISTR
jgi:hypothetical protein